MEIRVLARSDRREQPAVEPQAVDPAQPQGVAGDLHHHGCRAGVGESAEGAVELDRRRRRETLARIEEAPVARAERAEHARSLSGGVEQLAQDVARARLAEGAGEPDERHRRARGREVTRGQEGERVAARWNANNRDAGGNGAGAFGDDGRGAAHDGIADVGVAIE